MTTNEQPFDSSSIGTKYPLFSTLMLCNANHDDPSTNFISYQRFKQDPQYATPVSIGAVSMTGNELPSTENLLDSTILEMWDYCDKEWDRSNEKIALEAMKEKMEDIFTHDPPPPKILILGLPSIQNYRSNIGFQRETVRQWILACRIVHHYINKVWLKDKKWNAKVLIDTTYLNGPDEQPFIRAKFEIDEKISVDMSPIGFFLENFPSREYMIITFKSSNPIRQILADLCDNESPQVLPQVIFCAPWWIDQNSDHTAFAGDRNSTRVQALLEKYKSWPFSNNNNFKRVFGDLHLHISRYYHGHTPEFSIDSERSGGNTPNVEARKGKGKAHVRNAATSEG